ncbi:MAG: BlaI/MecI/CopY family transcriptional regulator [Lachnospiraceae bacterium]|nr:BlaI/MecI/CopY family transcriptional regulator [Lachnospiraceae bacterium]
MLIYMMTEAEMELANIIWEQEPVGSGELVKLAAERLNWKKSTTYTVLRKICENGIFRNEQSVISSVMSKEEYARRKGENYLEENYGGSLPGFIAAFLKKRKLSRTEIEEIARMIEEYRDEECENE